MNLPRYYIPVLTLIVVVGILLSPIPAAAAVRQVELLGSLPVDAPMAVVLDHSGQLLVARQKGGVKILAPTGAEIATLEGSDEQGKPLLPRPRGMALADERIFVSDEERDRIFIFDHSGKGLGSFGRSGDDPKEFDSPQGLLVSRGLLFVADTDNNRVQVFTPEGIYLHAFGRVGAGDALLQGPSQLAPGPHGHILVLDKTGQIKIFKPSGEFLGKLATTHLAVAMTADNEGVLLADKNTLQICKVSHQGKDLFCFGSKGSGRAQFLSASGMALDNAGKLYIADQEQNLLQIFASEAPSPSTRFDTQPLLTSVLWQNEIPGQKYTHVAVGPEGALLAIRKEKPYAIDILKDGKTTTTITLTNCEPVAVAAATDGNIWVLDGKKPQVLKVNPAGETLLAFGKSGSGEGSFDDPMDIAVSASGLIYVADTDNRRVQVFTAAGTLQHVIRTQEEGLLSLQPTALAIDAEENLCVLDKSRGIISLFNPEGQRTIAFGGLGSEAPQHFDKPLSVALTHNEIFVLDSGAATIKVFNRKGDYLRNFSSRGSDRGDLNSPASLVAISDTDILVADTGNARLQQFQLRYTPAPVMRLSGKAGQRQIALFWDKSAESYVESYRIYRKNNDAADFELLKETTANAFNDQEVLPGINYAYRVTAVARAGHEGGSERPFEAVPSKVVPPVPVDITATPQSWSVDLSWRTPESAAVLEYRIYRLIDDKRTLIGKTRETTFYEASLDPQTAYYYEVCSVSIDDVESEPVAIKTTTLIATRPPIEIEVVKLDEIFANTYKIYETAGVGTVRITNHTRSPLVKVKVNFAIKDYMDFPAEFEINNLAPGASEDITLKAVFTNAVLTLTEDTQLQGEITAAYYRNQELVKFSKIQTFTLFEKHRITWDEPERFSAFVTPKDPVILEFGRAIASQFSEYGDPLLFAGMSFDALGVLGVGYLQDPSNPYQVIAEKGDTVDYVQYPRETLSRKSGDCDDLVGLYSSILESLGIQTKVVEVPGHMFMVFAVPLQKENIPKSFRDMYIERDGQLWVPVEVTHVGSPFMKAWEIGVKNYQQWLDNGLSLMDIRAAWAKYKPASLPMTEWRPQLVSRDEIAARYKDELPTLRKIRVQNLGQACLNRLQDNPNDVDTLVQLGIIYARNGEPLEALPALEKARKLRPDDAAVLNNVANLYFMLDRYADAAACYTEAAKLDPADPLIWVNQARALLRLDKKAEAGEAFKKALALQPEIGEKYKSLAITLGSSF